MSGLAGMFDLRDAEQAKQYLDTLGVEYRFQCYHENLPDGCHRLGDHLEAFMRQLDKAREVYEFNCSNNNYGHSCFKVAQYNVLGKAGPMNVDKALEFYEKGCDYKYGPACHNIGLINYSGMVKQKKDFPKAAKYFEKGCTCGNTASCQTLSTMYITGKEGVEKDMKKAFDLATKGCAAGNMYSCANLSQMYKKGDGVEQNDDLAEKYKTRAKTLFKDATKSEKQIEFGK